MAAFSRRAFANSVPSRAWRSPPKRHTWVRNQQSCRQWDRIMSVRDPGFWWEGRGEELSHTPQVLPSGQSPVLKPSRGEGEQSEGETGRGDRERGQGERTGMPHGIIPCQLPAHKRPERHGSQTSSNWHRKRDAQQWFISASKISPNVHMKYLLKADRMPGERERFDKYQRTKIIQSIFCV